MGQAGGSTDLKNEIQEILVKSGHDRDMKEMKAKVSVEWLKQQQNINPVKPKM